LLVATHGAQTAAELDPAASMPPDPSGHSARGNLADQ